MSARENTLGALLLLLSLSACAPPVPKLVRERHYREALCAIDAVGDDDRARIRRAMMRDLDPMVQASLLHPPDRPPRMDVVDVRVATNAIPVDRLQVMVSPTERGMAPADLSAITLFTGERVPGPSTPSLGWMESFGALLAAASLGIIKVAPERRGPSGPTEAAIRQAAPRAARLASVLESHCEPPVPAGVAVRCHYVFVVDHDRSDDAAFDIRFTMESRPSRRECVDTQMVHLPLGPRSRLASTIAMRFPSFRHLDEIREPP